MAGISVGQMAPSFRLPSGQGPEVGLEDYRGRKHVIVWFTKGMACPFCRQQMSQLARAYEAFRARDAEILEVTNTPPERARVYVQKFALPFPYLCDPDFRVRRTWNLDARSHGVGYYARMMYLGMTMPKPATDYEGEKAKLSERGVRGGVAPSVGRTGASAPPDHEQETAYEEACAGGECRRGLPRAAGL